VQHRSDDDNLLRFARQGSGNHVRLVGDGEIDAHSVSVLRAVAEDAIGSGAERIDLDLERVTFIDSSGLRALAEAHSAAEARGSTLTIVELSGPVRRILEISGMLDALARGSSSAPGTS
jgi:anti-sigma B factor antagonist